VDVKLLDVGALSVHVFKFLRSNVLALSQFENVLRSIDNFDGSVGHDNANISRKQPSICVDCVCTLFRVFEVAGENRWSLEADFTAGVRLVFRGVFHLRNVSQTDLEARKRASDVSADGVVGQSDARGSGGFSLSVSFKDGAAEANLEEVKNVDSNGGRSSDHKSDIASEHLTELVAHQSVVELMSVGSLVLQVVKLALNSAVGEDSLGSRKSFEATLDLVIDTVKETRN